MATRVSMLADRAANRAALDDPLGVARLLNELREAGTREQVTALLHRNPAAHAHIDRRGIRVTSLRTALKEAVANNQMTALTTLIGRDNPSTTRTALSACCSPCGTRVPMARSPCSTPATMSPRCAGP